MAAPKGNKFWECRTKHGPDHKYPIGKKGAAQLWDDCVGYFEWTEENPLQEEKVFGKDAIRMELDKMRAMTVAGLCLYLGIDLSTWVDWRKSRKDLSNVITRVDMVIREQKFTGAAAGLLNPNIIARDLGLADTKQLTGPEGGPIQTITKEMTPQEAAEAYASTLRAD